MEPVVLEAALECRDCGLAHSGQATSRRQKQQRKQPTCLYIQPRIETMASGSLFTIGILSTILQFINTARKIFGHISHTEGGWRLPSTLYWGVKLYLLTSLHFISQCSYYVTTRMSIWGKPVLDPDDMKRIRVKDLARFILKSRRFLVNEISN